MNEQTIFLIFLVAALAVTLGLYLLKAKKQMQYKGDERWKLIQLLAPGDRDHILSGVFNQFLSALTEPVE